MFLELIATLFAGFAAAGVVMAVNYLLGGRLPGWATPVGAGAAMIGMAVWSEYTWYARTTASLPEGLEVTETARSTQVYRPWTYIVPLRDRFTAVDVGTMRRHAAQPDQRMADIYVFARWRKLNRFPVLIDCAGHRRALVPGGNAFRPDGTVEGAVWADLTADDPLITTACKRG